MPFELLVGLEVTDDEIYNIYRKEMTPILERVGGGFNYDFQISKTLKSAVPEKINRVFTIFFPSEDVMNSFFSDAAYKTIKEKHFQKSVLSTTIISSYTT